MSREKCRFPLEKEEEEDERGVYVWDEPPFVPKQGHGSSTYNVDTPETARIRGFLTAPLPRRSAGPAADRPSAAPPSAKSGRNAFFNAYYPPV